MVASRSGLRGLNAARHVMEERNIAIAHAPIPYQHTVEETVRDWEKLKICGCVTHKGAQVKAH